MLVISQKVLMVFGKANPPFNFALCLTNYIAFLFCLWGVISSWEWVSLLQVDFLASLKLKIGIEKIQVRGIACNISWPNLIIEDSSSQRISYGFMLCRTQIKTQPFDDLTLPISQSLQLVIPSAWWTVSCFCAFPYALQSAMLIKRFWS
jgi:hypothetical protein